MKKLAGLLITILILVGAGCASNFHFYNAGGGFMRSHQPADTASVYGRIIFIEDGVEKGSSFFFNTGMDQTGLTVYNVDRQILALNNDPSLTSDGSFEWIASPGTYVIRSFRVKKVGFDREVQPQVAFHVPQGAKRVYVGALYVTYNNGSLANVRVADESGPTGADTVKLLMVHDNTIPTDPHKQTKHNMSAVVTGFGRALLIVAPALAGAPL